MMPAILAFNSNMHGSSVLTIHKLNYIGLASFQPLNKSTVLHGFIHSHITSSDLVDNNAVSLYSQLNGLLTTLGMVHPSLKSRVTAFSSLGWYHTKRHNISASSGRKQKGFIKSKNLLVLLQLCYWYASCMHTVSSILKI